ncbi:MAG: AmmeMemoRadiSam system protein A, partial [Sedimentisphaerales bacterium]|nr:AmmeMemoRadiSam system protein A [Sedimentisphaerales bacterium]
MTDKQKKSLLEVARKVISAAVRRESVNDYESEDPLFNEKRGCFVTIHNHGVLRGCIGQFQPDQSLIRTVREMAVAATRDQRFLMNPITPAELEEIDIEISVLSPLEKTDDPLSLELGKHGIYIKQGWSTGCFLPQVATETGWSKEEFLSNCCGGKAGLAADAWKKSDTEVYLFTAEI